MTLENNLPGKHQDPYICMVNFHVWTETFNSLWAAHKGK